MADQRVAWIDISKGLGIIFVVIGHNHGFWAAVPTVAQIIYLFHMPLFFFISGLTLRLSLFSLYNRIVGTIVPYFFLSLAVVPIEIKLKSDLEWDDVLLGLIYGTGHTIDLVPMWFLPCLALSLFLAMFSLWILNKINNIHFRMLISLVFSSSLILLGGYFLSVSKSVYVDNFSWGTIEKSGYFWSADVAVLGAGFVLLGSCISNFLDSFNSSFLKKFVIVSCCIFVLIAGHKIGARIDLNHRHFSPVFVSSISALSGIFATIILSKWISKLNLISKPIIYIGQSSLIILWLHNGLQNRVANVCFGELIVQNNWFYFCLLSIVIPCIIHHQLILKFTLTRFFVYPRMRKVFANKKSSKLIV